MDRHDISGDLDAFERQNSERRKHYISELGEIVHSLSRSINVDSAGRHTQWLIGALARLFEPDNNFTLKSTLNLPRTDTSQGISELKKARASSEKDLDDLRRFKSEIHEMTIKVEELIRFIKNVHELDQQVNLAIDAEVTKLKFLERIIHTQDEVLLLETQIDSQKYDNNSKMEIPRLQELNSRSLNMASELEKLLSTGATIAQEKTGKEGLMNINPTSFSQQTGISILELLSDGQPRTASNVASELRQLSGNNEILDVQTVAKALSREYRIRKTIDRPSRGHYSSRYFLNPALAVEDAFNRGSIVDLRPFGLTLNLGSGSSSPSKEGLEEIWPEYPSGSNPYAQLFNDDGRKISGYSDTPLFWVNYPDDPGRSTYEPEEYSVSATCLVSLSAHPDKTIRDKIWVSDEWLAMNGDPLNSDIPPNYSRSSKKIKTRLVETRKLTRDDIAQIAGGRIANELSELLKNENSGMSHPKIGGYLDRIQPDEKLHLSVDTRTRIEKSMEEIGLLLDEISVFWFEDDFWGFEPTVDNVEDFEEIVNNYHAKRVKQHDRYGRALDEISGSQSTSVESMAILDKNISIQSIEIPLLAVELGLATKIGKSFVFNKNTFSELTPNLGQEEVVLDGGDNPFSYESEVHLYLKDHEPLERQIRSLIHLEITNYSSLGLDHRKLINHPKDLEDITWSQPLFGVNQFSKQALNFDGTENESLLSAPVFGYRSRTTLSEQDVAKQMKFTDVEEIRALFRFYTTVPPWIPMFTSDEDESQFRFDKDEMERWIAEENEND